MLGAVLFGRASEAAAVRKVDKNKPLGQWSGNLFASRDVVGPA